MPTRGRTTLADPVNPAPASETRKRLLAFLNNSKYYQSELMLSRLPQTGACRRGAVRVACRSPR